MKRDSAKLHLIKGGVSNSEEKLNSAVKQIHSIVTDLLHTNKVHGLLLPRQLHQLLDYLAKPNALQPYVALVETHCLFSQIKQRNKLKLGSSFKYRQMK